MKRYLACSMLIIFACAVMPSHSFAHNTAKYPATENVVKAKVFGIDALFVCTSDVPNIFVNVKIPYAPAKDVIIVAPVLLVEQHGNSPPAFII